MATHLILNGRFPQIIGNFFLVSFLTVTYFVPIKAQTCKGTLTFNKITGVSVQGANQIPLFSSNGNTVTAECNNRCRASSDCPGFLVNYETESCFKLDFNTDDFRKDLIASEAKVNFFEKVCLEGVQSCGKAWIFERVPGFELAGYDDRIEAGISSRIDCQELCLRERALPCRSVEYNYETLTCKLSSQTRRSQPSAYRATVEEVDYLENQCSPSPFREGACQYSEYEDQDIGFADLQLTVNSKEDCQRRCEETTAFNCHSFTFFPSTSICRLSGDDNISVGPLALQSRVGANYYQKAPCVDLSLVCSGTSMTITLNTVDPFEGKIYSVKQPKKCVIKGKGKTETSLTFLYQDPENLCGVETEGEGVFTNTIAIQSHPVIQQKGDRSIKLYCFFEVGDKTVTDSYNVIAEAVKPEEGGDRGEEFTSTPPTPTSIVNGTAPTPSVVLRIINGEGQDISGTKLGEPLYIRIELDGPSIFDIFARNLIAKSGLDDEEIVLIDERGCPADPVFPGLTKENGTGALIGKFEAFKFSDTTVVNFQVNVQFCQDQCNPVDCGEGVQSFGRRRRRRRQAEERQAKIGQAERVVYDPDLNQEIIVYDTPLRKQIFVDPGTKVSRFRDQTGEAISHAGPGIFVQGNFEDGDVVCTTWTMVIIAGSCIVFLVISILITCLLCLYNSRRSYKELKEQRLGGSNPPMSLVSQHSLARSASPFSHQDDSAHYGYSRNPPRIPENSVSTLRSLRTSLRD